MVSECLLGLGLGGLRRGFGSFDFLGARSWNSGDLRVLEFRAVLALEDGTAGGEGRGLVRLLGELALGVGLGEGSAVLDELEETTGVVVGWDAGRTAAEGRKLPGLLRLDGCATRGRKAHPREVCNSRNFIC